MELRVRSKQRSFINGGYRYNPVIDKRLIESHRWCRAEMTFFLAMNELRDGGDYLVRGRLMRMRAVHARIERRLRQRLHRGA